MNVKENCVWKATAGMIYAVTPYAKNILGQKAFNTSSQIMN